MESDEQAGCAYRSCWGKISSRVNFGGTLRRAMFLHCDAATLCFGSLSNNKSFVTTSFVLSRMCIAILGFIESDSLVLLLLRCTGDCLPRTIAK